MLQLGLSQAATVRAGNALGRGDAPHLVAGAKVVIALSLVGVALSMVLFTTFPDQLINLFLSPDEPKRAAILEIGRVLLVMAVLFQLVDAMQVVHLGFLRGLHDTGIPMVVAVISYWGIGFPAAWLFGTQMGFEGVGVWSGLVLGLSVAALLLGWRFWTWGTSQVKPVS
jgi:MATE family multidrug resistance protein